MDWANIDWGWWAPVIISVVLGVAGVAYGVWARAYPQHARLYLDVQATPIGLPNDPLVNVTYNGDPVVAPTLVTIEVKHVGGPEIPEFPEGAIKFVALDGGGTILGPLGEETARQLQNTTDCITVSPRIFKRSEKLHGTFIASDDPCLKPNMRIAGVNAVIDQSVKLSDAYRRARYMAYMTSSLTGVAIGALVVRGSVGGSAAPVLDLVATIATILVAISAAIAVALWRADK